MGTKRRGPTSEHWWASARADLKNLLTFKIRKAKEAELRETREEGNEHDCGHQWEITVRSAMHSGIVGEGAKSHRDAPFVDDAQPNPVTVRAHSLSDALIVAATLPLEEWFRGFLNDEGTLAVPRPPTRSERDWYRELQQFENELHDLMAEALGYPVYAPGEPGYSPDRPAYVTGDHTGMTLAMEAAAKLRTMRERGLL